MLQIKGGSACQPERQPVCRLLPVACTGPELQAPNVEKAQQAAQDR